MYALGEEKKTIDSKIKNNIVDCIFDASVEGIGVPKDELFNIVTVSMNPEISSAADPSTQFLVLTS